MFFSTAKSIIIYLGDGMKINKRIVYIVGCLFILVLGISLIVSNKDNNVEASADVDYDYSYYVENPSIISKLAFVCDDCCYYLVDIVLGGIESLFSKIIG